MVTKSICLFESGSTMPHGHHTATTYFNFSRSDDSLLPHRRLLKAGPVPIVVSPSFKSEEAALSSNERIHLSAHAHQMTVLSSLKPLGRFNLIRPIACASS